MNSFKQPFSMVDYRLFWTISFREQHFKLSPFEKQPALTALNATQASTTSIVKEAVKFAQIIVLLRVTLTTPAIWFLNQVTAMAKELQVVVKAIMEEVEVPVAEIWETPVRQLSYP